MFPIPYKIWWKHREYYRLFFNSLFLREPASRWLPLFGEDTENRTPIMAQTTPYNCRYTISPLIWRDWRDLNPRPHSVTGRYPKPLDHSRKFVRTRLFLRPVLLQVVLLPFQYSDHYLQKKCCYL